jgi:hypothetical protein
MDPGVRSQIVDVPVWSRGQLLMVGDPGAQASRPKRAPDINAVPGLNLHLSKPPDPNAGIARTRKDQRVSSRPRLNDHSDRCPVLSGSITFPTLVKYLERNLENHMANWKVIATVSGNIEAVSGAATQDRPGPHEWTVWEGPAADKAEALMCAEKADPRVDLEWMRIRSEKDLDIR